MKKCFFFPILTNIENELINYRFFLTPTEELDAEEFEYDIVEVEVEQPEDGCSLKVINFKL